MPKFEPKVPGMQI